MALHGTHIRVCDTYQGWVVNADRFDGQGGLEMPHDGTERGAKAVASALFCVIEDSGGLATLSGYYNKTVWTRACFRDGTYEEMIKMMEGR